MFGGGFSPVIRSLKLKKAGNLKIEDFEESNPWLILLLFQKHKHSLVKKYFNSSGTLNAGFFNFFLFNGTCHGRGRNRPLIVSLFRILFFSINAYRFVLSKPVNKTRTKTNSINCQLKLSHDYCLTFSWMGLKRRSLKERFNISKKRFKVVLKKKTKKVTKKKGPVIRSRDTKKSVWR